MLIILPLIIMGLYLNNHFADLAQRKTNDTILETLKQTRQNFQSIITDTNDLSVRILTNDQIQEFARNDYQKILEHDKIYWNINNWLNDIIGSQNNYNSISIYTDKEVYLQKRIQVPHIDLNVLDRASSLQGKGFWVTERGEIEYYRGIMDINKVGRMLGIVRFNLNEDNLFRIYNNIGSYSGSQISLLDSNGNVISSSERSMHGTNLGKLEYVRKILKNKEGFFNAEIDGVKKIVFFYTIEEANWTLMQTIPVESFSMLQQAIYLILLVVIMLCIFFGLLFSFIQHKYLLKPLLQLRREMAKLKNGNFNITLTIDSQDEIGEISNGFVRMAHQLKEMIDDVYLSKIKQREAELSALESKINPHFLYNTLDSIHWLAVKHKNYDVSEQIEALAEIFRHVLNKGDSLITIRQEISFIESYMLIQKRKYGKRISYQIEVDQELLEYKTPKLILQPLVENAIVHGLEEVVQGGFIKVEIIKAEQGILFVVTDNGKGTDEDRINRMMNDTTETRNVFALKNIDDRIKISYGSEFGLKFASQYNIGTQVEVHIPLIK
ncbi:sensor histidine kinase [Paenibacillus sp. FSL P4-0081]|uniref:sensor histidine kinase n=2 Tax=unclassified Paenibacillus TaxID=185978 RepID=UPI0018CEC63E|nr:sensor histidine kinase [Paenibacillus sp. FSL P4-0081]